MNVMRGPNRWSTEEKQLIVMKVRVTGFTAETREKFRRFVEQHFAPLAHLQPSPPDECGLCAQVALGLQNAAGMPVGFFLTGPATSSDSRSIVFSYQLEQAGEYAGEAAVTIADQIRDGLVPATEEHVSKLSSLKRKYGIGPTSTYLLEEVKRRDIPFRQFDQGSLITLGHGNRQKKIRTAVTDATSALGLEIAGDKEETKKLLSEANIPVPRGILVSSEEELLRRIGEVQFPLVIKPLDGNHGRGVTTDINSIEKAKFGFSIASRISRTVIVEEYVKGEDYRFLVINFQLVAAALRMPAFVTGDGVSTIRELIDRENENPQRGSTSEHVLATIKVDEVTNKILSEKNLTLAHVLKEGEQLRLKDTANISAGGTAIDVTDKVHPENRFMVERVAKMFNLDICGIDIMASAIDVPITREIGAIIEVNAGPGLRMHSNPQEGSKRDVAKPIIEMLFPHPASSAIPIVAVTGTNGKTTTTRLLAHMAKTAGHTPGFCTSDGIYIDGHQTYEGDCTGFVSAQQVLFDPTIDFAVLECARGGILRSGLGFSKCDAAIVTNLSEDHLGMKGINSIEDMMLVKKVVPLSVRNSGYAVLNADDPNVFRMTEGLKCNVALFSIDPENEHIKTHLRNNGLCVVLENSNITIMHGHKTVIENVTGIPLTFGGKAEFMIRNVLAAVAAATALGLNADVLRESLRTFIPSPDQTPGRMNIFEGENVKVIVDYAHNVDGFRELRKFFSRIDGYKTGVIAAPGDRRDSDIESMGMLAATTYDRIIIRNDKDLRGRSAKEINDLLMKGIRQVNADLPVDVVPEESDALDEALRLTEKNGWILFCADKVAGTISLVTDRLNSENMIGQH